MASIQKRAKGGYRAFIYVSGVRDSATFDTRREAENWASARETALRTEKNIPAGNRFTLQDALQRYATDVSPLHRGAKWEIVRLSSFAQQPGLPASLLVGSLRTDHFIAWRDARLRSVKPGTVLREMGLLSAVLEHARREWRWITDNPLKDLRRPPSPPHRDRVISRREIRALLSVMGYSPLRPIRSVSNACAVCFLLALRTGMRAGELCNLTWDNVHDGFCRLPVTKTKPRDVPLTQKAMRLIGRMQGFDPRLVFGISRPSLDALFRKYRIRAGLEGFTFHDSRHTAATWIAGRMRDNGLPAQQALLDMCKMFGWSDMSRALTYYNPSAADIARRIA